MLSGAHHSYVDPLDMSTASTSMAQENNTRSQHEFLLNAPTSHAEEPDTPRFMQQVGHQRFPHASIAYNYLFGGPTPMVSAPSDVGGQPFEEGSEGEEEISYSHPWSAPFEYMLPRETSQMVPPISVNSHQLSEGATSQARQFLGQHNPSPRSPQIPLMHEPYFLNSH